MKIHSVSCRNSFVGSQDDEISGKRKKTSSWNSMYNMIWFICKRKKKKRMTYFLWVTVTYSWLVFIVLFIFSYLSSADVYYVFIYKNTNKNLCAQIYTQGNVTLRSILQLSFLRLHIVSKQLLTINLLPM